MKHAEINILKMSLKLILFIYFCHFMDLRGACTKDSLAVHYAKEIFIGGGGGVIKPMQKELPLMA